MESLTSSTREPCKNQLQESLSILSLMQTKPSKTQKVSKKTYPSESLITTVWICFESFQKNCWFPFLSLQFWCKVQFCWIQTPQCPCYHFLSVLSMPVARLLTSLLSCTKQEFPDKPVKERNMLLELSNMIQLPISKETMHL